METAAAGVSPSLTAAARSSFRRGFKGGVTQPFPSSSSIVHVNEREREKFITRQSPIGEKYDYQ